MLPLVAEFTVELVMLRLPRAKIEPLEIDDVLSIVQPTIVDVSVHGFDESPREIEPAA